MLLGNLSSHHPAGMTGYRLSALTLKGLQGSTGRSSHRAERSASCGDPRWRQGDEPFGLFSPPWIRHLDVKVSTMAVVSRVCRLRIPAQGALGAGPDRREETMIVALYVFSLILGVAFWPCRFSGTFSEATETWTWVWTPVGSIWMGEGYTGGRGGTEVRGMPEPPRRHWTGCRPPGVEDLLHTHPLLLPFRLRGRGHPPHLRMEREFPCPQPSSRSSPGRLRRPHPRVVRVRAGLRVGDGPERGYLCRVPGPGDPSNPGELSGQGGGGAGREARGAPGPAPLVHRGPGGPGNLELRLRGGDGTGGGPGGPRG
jgi:hypothetical protein